MTFVDPVFSLGNIAYTAIGAAVFWGKWGRSELRAYVLSDLISALPIRDRKHRAALEFLLFVTIGVIVGVGLTEPTNAAQAVMAGLGWTGLFTATRKDKSAG